MSAPVVVIVGALAVGTVYLAMQSEAHNPPTHINGTVTSVTAYPGHTRAGVTATSTSRFVEVTDPKTQLITRNPAVTTGPVQWNPATEVCVRHDDGTSGCWYTAHDGFKVGERVGDIDTDVVCAPHPTPFDEAADEACSAFAADGDRVIPAVKP